MEGIPDQTADEVDLWAHEIRAMWTIWWLEVVHYRCGGIISDRGVIECMVQPTDHKQTTQEDLQLTIVGTSRRQIVLKLQPLHEVFRYASSKLDTYLGAPLSVEFSKCWRVRTFSPQGRKTSNRRVVRRKFSCNYEKDLTILVILAIWTLHSAQFFMLCSHKFYRLIKLFYIDLSHRQSPPWSS